ncbi:MAG: hypothetical protein HC767_03765, partial [Akkermansiaceae bacterium]|nr:hypothetical protein [Akkermansiaceae bacterium]
MSRLELFQSPAVKFEGGKHCQTGIPGKPDTSDRSNSRLAIFELPPSQFELLQSEGNDGCGYIDEESLSELFGGNAAAARLLGIQVRLLVPGLGLFKGMLARKRTGTMGSRAKILLTPSMQKVGPALSCARTRRSSSGGSPAVMLVNNKFPSPYSVSMGRTINPRHPLQPQGAPPKSEKPKALVKPGKPEMIPRLWKSLGVPSRVRDSYKENCIKGGWQHSKHSWVVGCTDPTRGIPPHHVFVTGCLDASREWVTDRFFVTRSPCIDPSDGRVLQQLTTRPPGMSVQDWDWLLSRNFGAIYFPDAPPGMKPMPSLIANGDLDGDYYFVCWDQDVLANLDVQVVEAVHYVP